MWFFSGKFILLSRFVQLAFSKPDARKILELKALCHVVRADCSLMNPHAPSNWARQMANKFVLLHSSLPTEAFYVTRSTFQALYVQYIPCLPLFLSIDCPYCKIVSILTWWLTKSLCYRCSISAYILQFTIMWLMLGMPILPVPTLIEFSR